MRGYEDKVPLVLGGDEDPFHILDGLVLGDARADHYPIRPFFAQHVVLWVYEDNGGV
jgi:hypothetical protein